MKSLLVLIALLSFFTPALAEESPEAELLASDIKGRRADIVAEVMQLSDSQGEIFWPIYEEMQLEMDHLRKSQRELIQEYLAVYNNLSDEVAGAMMLQVLELEKTELGIKKKYFGKIGEALSIKTAARFLQVENQIDLLLDAKTAAELPLIK